MSMQLGEIGIYPNRGRGLLTARTNLVTKRGPGKERADNFRSCGGLCGYVPIYIGRLVVRGAVIQMATKREVDFSFSFFLFLQVSDI